MSKTYQTTGRYPVIKIMKPLSGFIKIGRYGTVVESEADQRKVEVSSSFKRGFIAEVAGIDEVPEDEAVSPPSENPTQASFGLGELKGMHHTQVRAVAKKAGVWEKGMSKERMIQALIGG